MFSKQFYIWCQACQPGAKCAKRAKLASQPCSVFSVHHSAVERTVFDEQLY